MGIPVTYSWDDVDAPVVKGNDLLSIHKLFKACLVDGYGDKPGAGWTLPYTGTDATMGGDDNTVYCFRQGSGNGRFLQVGASLYRSGAATTNADSNWSACLVRGYDYMDSATSGTGRFPDIQPTFYKIGASVEWNADYGFVFSSYSPFNYSPVKRWKVIADNKFFYLIIEAATVGTNTANPQNFSRNWEFYYFGDFQSEVIGDYFNTVLRATRTVNQLYSSAAGENYQYKNQGNPATSTYNATTPLMCMPSSNGTISSAWGIVIRGAANATSGYVPANMWYAGMRTTSSVNFVSWAARAEDNFPSFENGNGSTAKIQLSKVMLIEQSPQPNRTICRGWLPGFYAPLSASPWGNWQILNFYAGQWAGYTFLTLSLDDFENKPENPGPCAAIATSIDWNT